MANINKQSMMYISQSCTLVVLLSVLCWMFRGSVEHDIVMPMAVSTVFVLLLEVTTALVWRWVATKHANMLPSFFTAVSGFRFLSALVIMAVWYLAVGQESMMTFILVFLAYYMVSLIHHSIFFSRVSKRL